MKIPASRDTSTHVARILCVSMLVVAIGCTRSVSSESVDPDADPNSPGAITKGLDPKLYGMYRPYMERAAEIACDTCFGPKVSDQMRAFRRKPRPAEEADYIVEVMQRELDATNPNWDILVVALSASQFGMGNNSKLRNICVEVLKDIPSLPEDRLDAGALAASVLSASGSESDLDLVIATVHPKKVESVHDGMTEARFMLGHRISGFVAFNPPRTEALAALPKIVELLSPEVPEEEPEASYAGSIINSAEVHMEQLRSELKR